MVAFDMILRLLYNVQYWYNRTGIQRRLKTHSYTALKCSPGWQLLQKS